jgi:thiamine kinase-like enzyme
MASDDKAATILAELLNTCEVRKIESLQALWSGYGEIARYYDVGNDRSLIVKKVDPSQTQKHPRNWNTSNSHQRKLSSYHNERLFYQHYAHFTDPFCRVPKCIATRSSEHEEESLSWLIMDDLDSLGFSARSTHPDLQKVKLGLRWLAYFHAQFLQKDCDKLWPVGTYWHLSTRPDEWQKMPPSELKLNAAKINMKLNHANYQTLVHGDAKVANFCFTEDGSDLAAVDFQYVGKGVGIKDVIYFLGSCLSDTSLHKEADKLIHYYFELLRHAASAYSCDQDIEAVIKEWAGLAPFAWADFERFLIGWAPDHAKLNSFSREQTDIALRLLEA